MLSVLGAPMLALAWLDGRLLPLTIITTADTTSACASLAIDRDARPSSNNKRAYA